MTDDSKPSDLPGTERAPAPTSPVLRVTARSLRRGAPAGELPRALVLSLVVHGATLAGVLTVGEHLAGGPPAEARAAQLSVARAAPRSTLEEAVEPEWALEIEPPEALPELREAEPPMEEPAPTPELAPAVTERAFERLPLEPLVARAQVDPEPSPEPPEPRDEGEPVEPSDPLEETLVVGERETDAVLVEGPAPRYPPLALRRGWEGTTVVRIAVAADGRVTDVSVETTSGYDLLDEAALEAIRAWRFKPGTRGGLARATELLHRVRFRLVDARR